MTDHPALFNAARWLQANQIPVPKDIETNLSLCGVAIKAQWDYNNALTRIVLIYLNDLITAPGRAGETFGVDFADAIESGLNEAWRLGMRENDVTEMDPDWQDMVDEIVAGERLHIPDFAAYLTEVAGHSDNVGQAMSTVSSRLDMWINRYNDVYNQAIAKTADEKTKLVWVYGDTQHCDTCARLNGIVAYAREWDEAGISPQNPPNGALSCGGWQCQCSLKPTTERHTRNALDRLLSIAGQQGKD